MVRSSELASKLAVRFVRRVKRLLTPDIVVDWTTAMAIEPAQYAISVDRARLLVTLRVAGFLVPDQVERIAVEEQAAVKALGVSSGVHRFLIDVRALDALSLEVVSQIQHTTDTVELKPARFAVLVRYGLNSIQTRRMIADRAIGIFDNEEEAIAYLMQ